ncbi:MAG: hypothetical protein ACKVIH_08515 [Burkholderiales bacterium]
MNSMPKNGLESLKTTLAKPLLGKKPVRSAKNQEKMAFLKYEKAFISFVGVRIALPFFTIYSIALVCASQSQVNAA